MSQPNSRSQRRQQQQRGGPAAPQKRDPMMSVYIALAVVVVLIVAGFGIMRWQQNNALNAAYATPSPEPTVSGGPSPIPLVDGTALGKPMIATPNSKFGGDTKSGGQGQPVDGIACAGQEYVTLHVHPHLALFYHGQQVQVPHFIGSAAVPPQGCLYWIHTHDASGIIHVEAPQLSPPGGSDYNLGIFFDIWGQPLSRDNVAGLKGPVTAYVNGQKYDGDLRMIPLKAHNLITLEIGTPLVTPPNYSFPPNE